MLWRGEDSLRLDPDSIRPEQITCARLLHIDGHDTNAVARAAEIASQPQDPGHRGCRYDLPWLRSRLPNVDYLVASSEFPLQWTTERDAFKALETIQEEYRIPVAAMTLGAQGATGSRR